MTLLRKTETRKKRSNRVLARVLLKKRLDSIFERAWRGKRTAWRGYVKRRREDAQVSEARAGGRVDKALGEADGESFKDAPEFVVHWGERHSRGLAEVGP